MFTEKDILARLQNGEDVQKIADEMAAVINAANKAYADQKAAEEAAKKQNEIQKREDLQEILDLFSDWLNAHYGIGAKGDISADQVIELIESLEDYFKAIKDLEVVFGAAKPAKKAVKTKSADETIDQFLKQMGW